MIQTQAIREGKKYIYLSFLNMFLTSNHDLNVIEKLMFRKLSQLLDQLIEFGWVLTWWK
jgi:hypothetical protein